MTDPMELVGRLEMLVNPDDLIVGPHMMRAALEEAAACIREMVEWRPIETAPRDGTPFVGLKGRLSFRTKMQDYYVKAPHEEGGPTFRQAWTAEDSSSLFPWSPTHWLPLPPAPGAEDE